MQLKLQSGTTIQTLNKLKKELLEELAASLGETQTPRNSSFTGKAKRFWADILGSENAQ